MQCCLFGYESITSQLPSAHLERYSQIPVEDAPTKLVVFDLLAYGPNLQAYGPEELCARPRRRGRGAVYPEDGVRALPPLGCPLGSSGGGTLKGKHVTLYTHRVGAESLFVKKTWQVDIF